MIDLHCHLIPGVDDGATNIDEARAALRLMRSQGVRGLVVTPHLSGAATLRADRFAAELDRIDSGWRALRELAAAELPDLRLERGAEVMLDTRAPDLSEPRVRLAGTDFVLIEFPFMAVPRTGSAAIGELKAAGWVPVIAHPERYAGIDTEFEIVEAWRRAGGVLQVNGGSLLGRHGRTAKTIAWRLLRRGWADYLSSDYHARGRCSIADVRTRIAEIGGEEQATLLMEVNPERLLRNLPPEAVPAVPPSRWRRFLRPGDG